jgi:hypothetical protein
MIAEDNPIKKREVDIEGIFFKNMEENIEYRYLLLEVLNSDMAMREEDEGEISPLLEKIRKTLKKNNLFDLKEHS